MPNKTSTKSSPEELLKMFAQQNTISPERGPFHRYLSEFVGRWKIAGENATSDARKSEHVVGEEIYEWLSGEYFLVNRFERKTATSLFMGLGWISYDAATESYLSYSISNLGFLRIYQVEIEDGAMRFFGDTERADFKLDKVGNTMTIRWEQRLDGESEWQPLCDLKARRLDS